MTPAELRRAATEVKAVVTEGLYLCQEPREAFAATIAQLCDHVLSTVREDDDEPITEEWLKSLGWLKLDRPTVYIDQSGAVEYQPLQKIICCRGWGRPHIQTRRQLRQLLAGLGVGCA